MYEDEPLLHKVCNLQSFKLSNHPFHWQWCGRNAADIKLRKHQNGGIELTNTSIYSDLNTFLDSSKGCKFVTILNQQDEPNCVHWYDFRNQEQVDQFLQSVKV